MNKIKEFQKRILAQWNSMSYEQKEFTIFMMVTFSVINVAIATILAVVF